jgi:hypothetical protein
VHEAQGSFHFRDMSLRCSLSAHSPPSPTGPAPSPITAGINCMTGRLLWPVIFASPFTAITHAIMARREMSDEPPVVIEADGSKRKASEPPTGAAAPKRRRQTAPAESSEAAAAKKEAAPPQCPFGAAVYNVVWTRDRTTAVPTGDEQTELGTSCTDCRIVGSYNDLAAANRRAEMFVQKFILNSKGKPFSLRGLKDDSLEQALVDLDDDEGVKGVSHDGRLVYGFQDAKQGERTVTVRLTNMRGVKPTVAAVKKEEEEEEEVSISSPLPA